MTKKKPERLEAKKAGSPKAGQRQEGLGNKASDVDAAGKSSGEDIQDRGDQIGSIFSKVLQLAECSVDLGINLMSRLSSLALGQDIGKMTGGREHAGEQYYTPSEEMNTGSQPFFQEQPGGTSDASGYSKGHCVTNRMPLFPGSPVHISFSINNDSPVSEKKLHLKAQDFIGATHHFKMDQHAFSVDPADRVIAPMDFEKFILTGIIPPDAPEDSYNGWIVLAGDEEIKISVILAVTAHL
ncbi:MAG: hypothetical protein C4B58_06675 [Deltaproteobacteria bacterium]|nr:MAG: hypothetical protein C4B58_06675 [Deltaproteobacteria bacterium]